MEIKKPIAVGLIAASVACRHPHIEVRGFIPEPQPTNPFVLVSTATANVYNCFNDWQLETHRRFRVVI